MADQGHQVHDLTPEEVSKGMAEGRYLLVDVREPNEVAVEAYPGAVVVPLSSFDPQDIPDPAGQAGGVRLPLRQAIGNGLAGGPGGRPCLRQASRGRHAGLEGRGIADQDRRLTVSMTSMNKVFADLPVTDLRGDVASSRATTTPSISARVFPTIPGPEDIRRAAADAVMDGYNQYPSMMGIPELRQAIAAHYGRWHGLTLDPMTEVMVTSGGTEALTSGHSGRGRARRRGRGFPAGLRFLSPDHPPGRRHSAPGAARAAALAADRGGAARRLQPQDQGRAVQQSAQSRRRGLSARGPRIAGAVLPGVRYDRDLRRGLGARGLRWPRAYSADHHSGNARSHHQGRLRRARFFR